MNCVIITLTYPFGNGDPFLRDELKVISSEFETIFILPLIKTKEEADYLPDNAFVISEKTAGIYNFLGAAINTVNIFKEVLFGYRSGYSNLKKILHRAFMYEYRYYSVINQLQKFDAKDTVFYSYWLSEPAYILARYKMQNERIYTVSRAHGYDCFKDRGYNPYRREIAETIDAIYSVSKKGEIDLERNLIPLARNKHLVEISTSHLGVDASEIVNPGTTDDFLFRIVSCSSVVQIKRLDILAKAILSVNCREKRIEWIHFGDGELLDSIKRLVENTQITRNIGIVFKGNVPHDEILNYYKATHVDLFINCSDAEGIPVSMMEAMEYGIPCIARNVGGISELIDNEVNGYLLPAKADPDMLKDLIEELIRTGIKEEIRNNAKTKISNEFNNSINYQKFAKDIISNYRVFNGAKVH